LTWGGLCRHHGGGSISTLQDERALGAGQAGRNHDRREAPLTTPVVLALTLLAAAPSAWLASRLTRVYAPAGGGISAVPVSAGVLATFAWAAQATPPGLILLVSLGLWPSST
jgi:hypothetical protein